MSISWTTVSVMIIALSKNGVDARVAVRAVHEHGRADRRVQPRLQVHVARVEAAHEADVTSRRPSAASASTTRSAAAASTASGFSHSTGLPASRQASVNGSCVGAGEAIDDRLDVGRAISSRPSS